MWLNTPRKELVLKFKNVDAVNDLRRRGILKYAGNPETYTPSIAAFELAGDAEFILRAKEAISVALHTLRNLYEIENENNFTITHVIEHAHRIYDAVDDRALQIGLYLCQDFRVFRNFASNQESTKILNFQISEEIVELSDVDTLWTSEVSRYLKNEDESPAGFSPEEPVEMFVPRSGSQPLTVDWTLLHQNVVKIARTRYESGHYADSVEAALKSVNERVREAVKAERGIEMDGAALMQYAFSLDKPILRLGDLTTTSGKNMQVGYLQIFAGSMTGIRNPKAHGNIQIDAIRAVHFLFLASLLMHKLDEAEALMRVQMQAISPTSQNTP